VKRANIASIVAVAETAFQVSLFPIPRKTILYQGKDKSGQTIALCTPGSAFYESINAWWVDITEIQKFVLDQYDRAIVIFRLDGSDKFKIVIVEYKILKEYLIEEAKFYNKNEGLHWKIYIRENELEIRKNSKRVPIQIVSL